MKFTPVSTSPYEIDADSIIVFATKDDFPAGLKAPQAVSALITEDAKRENFVAKPGEMLTVFTKGVATAYKLFVVGIAKTQENAFERQTVIAKAIRKAREGQPAKIGIALPADWNASDAVAAIKKSLYTFRKYKSDKKEKNPRELEEVIVIMNADQIEAAKKEIATAEEIMKAIYFTRDLINEPSEMTTPTYLAQQAMDIAKNSGGTVTTEIWEKERIVKEGMGAFWGVAKGSDEPPKFIRMEYKSKNPKKKVVIIGKGITFDSGGLSLKGAEHMETMKLDMSGGAAVLGTFSALGILAPEIHVIGLIAACENMPSGKSVKPGDILRAYDGKTIEVLNTDAEGRLTLADVLSYAVKNDKPDAMIDLATLTGACMIALGHEIAGLWGNKAELTKAILNAADLAGDRVWPMPLPKDYKKLLKSHIADLKNIAGRYGGAVTAALFLQEFVGDTPWVHLDIAGPSYAEKETPLTPVGGVGFGVGLLLSYLMSEVKR